MDIEKISQETIQNQAENLSFLIKSKSFFPALKKLYVNKPSTSPRNTLSIKLYGIKYLFMTKDTNKKQD